MTARITTSRRRPGRLALATALASCIPAGCGDRARVVSGSTFLDGKPRGLHVRDDRTEGSAADRSSLDF
ncbi:MAG: hypothetical protein ACYS9X_28000, partial [Planctomycetota bacterium]